MRLLLCILVATALNILQMFSIALSLFSGKLPVSLKHSNIHHDDAVAAALLSMLLQNFITPRNKVTQEKKHNCSLINRQVTKVNMLCL